MRALFCWEEEGGEGMDGWMDVYKASARCGFIVQVWMSEVVLGMYNDG